MFGKGIHRMQRMTHPYARGISWREWQLSQARRPPQPPSQPYPDDHPGRRWLKRQPQASAAWRPR